MADESLERLRAICLALPETSERLSHGEPAWFIREKKTFATFADHHHDDRLAFWCAAPQGAQHALVTAHPERFFIPPYVGHRGWLGVWLDVSVEWDEIADLVLALNRIQSRRSDCLRDWMRLRTSRQGPSFLVSPSPNGLGEGPR